MFQRGAKNGKVYILDTGNPWAMSSVHFMAAVNLCIKGDGVGNPLDFCTCERLKVSELFLSGVFELTVSRAAER